MSPVAVLIVGTICFAVVVKVIGFILFEMDAHRFGSAWLEESCRAARLAREVERLETELQKEREKSPYR